MADEDCREDIPASKGGWPYDLTKMKKGFEKGKSRGDGRAAKRGARIKDAWEKHRSKQ